MSGVARPGGSSTTRGRLLALAPLAALVCVAGLSLLVTGASPTRLAPEEAYLAPGAGQTQRGHGAAVA